MGLFSTSEFDELSTLIERATSEYIPAAQEDLALNLEITDVIKSKRVAPKDCLRLIIARLTHANPNVQLLTLQLLDKCVKNAGKHFLVELAGREFVDVAVEMMDYEEYGNDCNQMVQDRLIELFQEWAILFQSDQSLSYLYDTYTNLKVNKRVIFPVPAKSLDQVDPLSIVSSLSPPEWNDSPTCQRCRDTFTLTNRKHHCRKCGGTFCHLCSSNETVLLDMGISDPVRVCDTCYRTPQPTAVHKRQAKLFKKEANDDDLEFKKAIELSLKEQETDKTNFEKNEHEEALKKAIEASLKEVGPTHMSPQPVESQVNVKQETITDGQLSAIEQENIVMFHQLIGRLVRTRPTLQQEDEIDLKKLAEEMRRLQRKDEKSDGKIAEALRGYDLLINNTTTTSMSSDTNRIQSPPTSSSASKDLNQLRTEMFGDNSTLGIRSSEMGMVRTRLGSMSLEGQNYVPEYSEKMGVEYTPSVASVNQSSNIHAGAQSIQPVMQQPIGMPTSMPQPQSQLQQQSKFHRHTIHAAYPHPIMPLQPRPSPFQVTPIQMCPDLTIHPHPIHPPFSHENPYAKAAIVEDKKDKKKKKKKKRKSKEDVKVKVKKEKKSSEKADKSKDKTKKKEKEKDKYNDKQKDKDTLESVESSEKKEKKRKHKKDKKERGEHTEPEKRQEHKKHKQSESKDKELTANKKSKSSKKNKKKEEDKQKTSTSAPTAEVTNLIDL